MIIPEKKTLKNLGVTTYVEPEVTFSTQKLGKTERRRRDAIRSIRIRRREEKIFKKIGMNNTDINNNFFVGVEFESRFEPTGPELRIMSKFFVKNELIKRVTNRFDVFRIIRHTILNNVSEIIASGPPVMDGGGLELRFQPMTLKAHQHLREEYSRIIDIMKEFGFRDGIGMDGIHTNIDNAIFGPNKPYRRRGLANFLWFLFNEQDFMFEFCARPAVDDGMADLMTLLHNRFGNMSAEEVEETFIIQKLDLLDGITEGRDTRNMNIHINRDGRSCLEFRWFGSTHYLNTFMSFIEFSFALPLYSKSHNSPTTINLDSFCEFVSQNYVTYGDLYVRMCNMELTKNRMTRVATARLQF